MGSAPERQTIVQIRYVSGYQKRVDRLMTARARAEMEDEIALTADRHPIIRQTGGWRKARWAIKNKGKSAGVRVIYFFVSKPGTVFFADIYAKNEKENLTEDDKKMLQKLGTAIKGGIS